MKNLSELVKNRQKIVLDAYAKINLALDVTGRLDNGYHLVKMIMESISIKDVISISCVDKPGIRLGCNRDDLSCGEDNLIVKAAKAILDEAGIVLADEPYGLDIYLEKNIPMAAGMAGGSTDAAAILKGLNSLFEIGFDTEKLCDIGVKLGADIPYCIKGGSFLSEGIGEVLSPIAPPPKAYIAVIKPNIDVSTKYVYEHLDTKGVNKHPDVDGMITAMENCDFKGVCDRLGNVLRDVTVEKHPVIYQLEQYLCEEGAGGALMSGSGPTVFALFESKDMCLNTVQKARERYPEMFVSEAEFVL